MMTIAEALSSSQPYTEEADFLKDLKDWLELQPNTKVLRICDRYQKGYADLFLCVNGTFVAMELKDDKGTASPHQKQFITDIQKAGGIAGVCRSFQDAASLLCAANARTGHYDFRR